MCRFFSSIFAFNPILTYKLVSRFELSQSSQRVRESSCISMSLSLSSGSPQGCVLNPLPFRPYTHVWSPRRQKNILLTQKKFYIKKSTLWSLRRRKMTGCHYLYRRGLWFESPRYEKSDLGLEQSGAVEEGPGETCLLEGSQQEQHPRESAVVLLSPLTGSTLTWCLPVFGSPASKLSRRKRSRGSKGCPENSWLPSTTGHHSVPRDAQAADAGASLHKHTLFYPAAINAL